MRLALKRGMMVAIECLDIFTQSGDKPILLCS